MLDLFVPLSEGDWIVQNGANSAVCTAFSDPHIWSLTAIIIAGWQACHTNSENKRDQHHQLCTSTVSPSSRGRCYTEAYPYSDNLAGLVKELEKLGANKVLTYDELNEKSLRGKIKEWTGGKVNRTIYPA